MIKIEFEQKSKKEILIFGIDVAGKKKEIGRIFTPSGTGRDTPNAIQVCGISQIFDYWGCGVIFDKDGNPTKDIQLLFDKGNITNSSVLLKWDMEKDCGRCFYPEDKCMCWEFQLIRKEDIPEVKKKREEILMKYKILEKLEDGK